MFALDLPTENLLYLVLYLVTLLLHVVAMNYVVGGAMVLAGASIYRLVGNYCDATRSIVTVIKDWLPLALGVTITLGVAPILFVQMLYKHAFYTANLLLFHRWMSILPVLIVAFYLLYLQKSDWIERRAQVVRAVVAVGVLAMFLFVAWSWSENHLLSLASQQQWTEHYAGGRMWYTNPETFPRMSLWMIGSLATLSVMVAWQLRGSADTTTVRRLALIGLTGAIGSVLVAGWYWSALPEAVRTAIGEPANLSLVLAGGVGLAMFAAAWVQMARSGRMATQLLWLATAGLAVAIPCATLLREVRRYVALVEVDHWQPAVEATKNSAQFGGFGVFLLFFVLNAFVIGWIVRRVNQQLKHAP